MKSKLFFSLFFAICFIVHIHEIIIGTPKEWLWHFLYFITYGICWAMFFVKWKNRHLLYGLMALFPFFTHVFYAYRDRNQFNVPFFVCILVCVILPFGYWSLRQKA